MLPTLANGESVLAIRTRPYSDLVLRGDIVVFRHPVWNDRIYIKRIVGLPDEDLRMEDGRVYIDGEILEEAYFCGSFAKGRDSDRDWWLGADEYFLLGDNRHDSHDSRAFGPVNRRFILGRVWFRCWPLRSLGIVAGSSISGG